MLKQFDKLITGIAWEHGILKVFEDFLSIAICCYAYGKYETEYEEITSKYTPEQLDKFAQLLALLQTQAKSTGEWGDVLGDFYMEVTNSKDQQATGQFFTPVSVCNLMAAVTVTDKAEPGKIRTVSDPSCGSGRNLIALARQHPENIRRYFYIGQDLSLTACKMAAINYWTYGMQGAVIQMNTLTLEVYRGWHIARPYAFQGITKLTDTQCAKFVHN